MNIFKNKQVLQTTAYCPIKHMKLTDFANTKKRIRKRKMFIDDGPDSDESNATNFKITKYGNLR